MNRAKGTLMLLLAAMIWGVAFTAQTSASQFVGPFTFNGTRTLLAAVVLTVVIQVRNATSRHALQASRAGAPMDGGHLDPSSESQTSTAPAPGIAALFSGSPLRVAILGGVVCGLVLFVSDNLQQYGITVYPPEAASSGRAGFITATYVVMVALLSWFVGKRLHPLTLVATAVCLAGMYLLCLSGGFGGVYLGDALVLASAVGYAAHIMVIDRYARCDGLVLTCAQFYTSGSIALACALVLEHPEPSAILSALLPILYAGIFSSGMGYTLQTFGQKHAEPTVAAIVLSLESVFAALAGWLILSESMSGREVLGCVLVFAAVILAQVPDMLAARRNAGSEPAAG